MRMRVRGQIGVRALLMAFVMSLEVVSVSTAAAVDELFALVIFVVVEVANQFLVAGSLLRIWPAG